MFSLFADGLDANPNATILSVILGALVPLSLYVLYLWTKKLK